MLHTSPENHPLTSCQSSSICSGQLKRNKVVNSFHIKLPFFLVFCCSPWSFLMVHFMIVVSRKILCGGADRTQVQEQGEIIDAATWCSSNYKYFNFNWGWDMIPDLPDFFSKINTGKRHKGKRIWIQDLREKYFLSILGKEEVFIRDLKNA